MNPPNSFSVQAIGVVRSELKDRAAAPKQGEEGAPDAWLEIRPEFIAGLQGIRVGDALLVFTWLHQGARDELQVHPRGDPSNPLTGVFATRSPNRPNPIGLHRVIVRAVEPGCLRVGPFEAIDATPVIDLKPVLGRGEG